MVGFGLWYTYPVGTKLISDRSTFNDKTLTWWCRWVPGQGLWVHVSPHWLRPPRVFTDFSSFVPCAYKDEMLGLKVETHRETQARRGLQRPRQAFALRLSAPRPEAVSSSARHVEGSQWDRAAGCGHGLRWFFATAVRVRPVRARMGARVGFLSLYGFSCLRRHFTPWIAKCHPPG